MTIQKRLESFKYAFEGIKWVFIEHPNFKIHIVCSLLAIGGAILLKFNMIEWSILVITIWVVFAAEMMNTAIEEITDLVTVKWSKQAKIAKDVAAGMVLVAAIGALIIGLIIFLPKLI